MQFNPKSRFFLLVFLFVGLWLLAQKFQVDVDAIRLWLKPYPLFLSGVLFILIYVGLTSIFWFGTIDFFRITGALLFGPYWSTLFVWIAETANAAILFHVSRGLGRDYIREKFKLKPKDLEYGQGKAGFWTVFILRINPLVPFRLMDIGFGLSRIAFKKYFWGIALGSPLRIFWLQFVIFGIEKTIFTDPQALMNYFKTHPQAFIFSAAYMGGVFILTGAAIVVGMIKNPKIPKRNK